MDNPSFSDTDEGTGSSTSPDKDAKNSSSPRIAGNNMNGSKSGLPSKDMASSLPGSSEITLKTAFRHMLSGVYSDGNESATESHASHDTSSSADTSGMVMDNAAFSDTDLEGSVAGSSEVTTKTYFRYVPQNVVSETDTASVAGSHSSHDDAISSGAVSSLGKTASIETVQPYAVSTPFGLTVDISQSAIDSAYHNPYAHAYAVSNIDDETSARGSSVPASPGATSEVSFTQALSTDGSVSHSAKAAKVSSPGVYTRQLNMFIGEEWEDVQPRWPIERKALSCPGSLRIPQVATHQQRIPFKQGPSDIQRLEYIQNRRQQMAHDPLRYFFYHTSHEEPVPQKDYMIKANPYNNINHMIHSALHCPCFFFFYLLCCLPGVHLMQKGDIEYKTGHDERAKKYGRVATILYIIGFVLGTALLGTVVFLAVSFVKGQVE